MLLENVAHIDEGSVGLGEGCRNLIVQSVIGTLLCAFGEIFAVLKGSVGDENVDDLNLHTACTVFKSGDLCVNGIVYELIDLGNGSDIGTAVIFYGLAEEEIAVLTENYFEFVGTGLCHSVALNGYIASGAFFLAVYLCGDGKRTGISAVKIVLKDIITVERVNGNGIHRAGSGNYCAFLTRAADNNDLGRGVNDSGNGRTCGIALLRRRLGLFFFINYILGEIQRRNIVDSRTGEADAGR
jgi:hypothetical protein